MRRLTLVCIMVQLGTFGALAQSATEYYLPHIANGSFDAGSFRTTFIFFNNGPENETVRLRLTGDDGNPLTLAIPDLGRGSEFAIDLPVGSTRTYQTDGSGELVTGAAKTTYQGVSAIFSVYDRSGTFLTEAGVGDSPLNTYSVIPVDVRSQFNTGLALFNPGPNEASVSLVLRDTAGKTTAQTTLTLPSGGHLARFIAGPGQLFPSVASIRGTLSIGSSDGVSALVLRQNSSPLSHTSLPAGFT